MNEFNTLQSLRNDVPLPSTDDLAPAYARLEQAMAAEAAAGSAVVGSGSRSARTGRKSLKRRLAWIAGSVVGTIALGFGAGQAAMAYDSSQAASRLHDIAGSAITFDDASVNAGQYLRAQTHSKMFVCSTGAELDEFGLRVESSAETECITGAATEDVYMPFDSTKEWVLVREESERSDRSGLRFTGDPITKLRAREGVFYGEKWLKADHQAIPTESGAAAFQWIDAQHTGDSASRDEDNFERIQDILTSGLVPAPQRAALFEALAMIPGVTSTPDVANFDGVKGIAFGRNSLWRSDQRMEIIVDPRTGLVIGERTITGLAMLDFDLSDELGLTAITTTVVDSAPSDTVPVTEE